MAQTELTEKETELLQSLDIASAFFKPHQELTSLLKYGFADTQFVKFANNCFDAEVFITPHGIAKLHKLN